MKAVRRRILGQIWSLALDQADIQIESQVWWQVWGLFCNQDASSIWGHVIEHVTREIN